jgi:hypothetical protein
MILQPCPKSFNKRGSQTWTKASETVDQKKSFVPYIVITEMEKQINTMRITLARIYIPHILLKKLKYEEIFKQGVCVKLKQLL